MSPSQQPPPATRFVTLGGVAVVVAALYFARDVCIPLALGILLSFLLAPLVMLLRRWRFGRILSVLSAVTVAFALLGFLAWLTASQLYDLAAKLPQYETNIRQKVQSFAKPGGGILGKSRRLFQQLNKDLTTVGKPAETEEPVRTAAPPAKPIPVEIHQPEPTSVQMLRSLLKTSATG
jgi:predicted PurR-regulated permease PerM